MGDPKVLGYSDFNDLPKGIYSYNKDGTGACSNAPSGYGVLIVTGIAGQAGGGYPNLQIFIDNTALNMWIRITWSNTWTPWAKTTFTRA